MSSERLIEVAAVALDHGWDWQAVGRPGAPETDAILSPILDAMEEALSDADAARFAGYVPIVGRPGESPARALARAKLAHGLGTAMDTVRFSRAIDSSLADAPIFDAFPELRQHLDDDDLVPAHLFRPLPDAFEYQHHAFAFSEFTPQYLRRRLTALAKSGEGGLSWRPAIAPPVPVAAYQERLEEAIEYGVSFREDLIFKRLWNRHLPTVLRREAPVTKAEIAYDGLNPIERLEILRTERGNRISFLFEELIPLAERHNECGYVLTRIFHCDTVVGKKTFEHVDSSQLIYRVETYEKRLRSAMKDKVKAEGHLKLFWLPGCPIDTWKALLCATYPRNELVGEYLTGERSVRPVSIRAPNTRAPSHAALVGDENAGPAATSRADKKKANVRKSSKKGPDLRSKPKPGGRG